jgi:hypothetical protein
MNAKSKRMKCRKTDAAKALLKLKDWLKKRGRPYAEWLLSQALPDASNDAPLMVDIGLKQTIARVMISCVENYELADFWRGCDGDYFVEYIEGFDDFGRELDEDEDYDAPVKVRHPDGDIKEEWDDRYADAVRDYLVDNGILLLDDQIYASNTGGARESHEMEVQCAPSFPVLNKLVTEAERRFDDVSRLLTERCRAGGE